MEESFFNYMSIPKRHFSWKDVETACLYLKSQIEEANFKPDYIVGLTRGGLIPAVILSHLTGIKLIPLDASFRDSNLSPESNCWLPEEVHFNDKKVFIVDDINDSGKTFNWIKGDWASSLTFEELGFDNIKFATLVHNKGSCEPTDFSFLTINKLEKDEWIVYPWESEND